MNKILRRSLIISLVVVAILVFATVAYLRRPSADVTDAGASTPGVIWGRVTDTSGKPLAGIAISLGSEGSITGPQGGYILTTDSLGAQPIYFKHRDTLEMYQEIPSQEAIVVPPGQSINYDFAITRLETQPTPITVEPESITSPSPVASNAQSSTVLPSTTPAPRPAQPTNLTASTKQNPRRTELKWKDNANSETGFTVVRTEDKSFKVKLTDVAANTTSFNDTTAERGKTYFYKVRAFTGSGASKSYSTYSNEKKITIK